MVNLYCSDPHEILAFSIFFIILVLQHVLVILYKLVTYPLVTLQYGGGYYSRYGARGHDLAEECEEQEE